MAVEQRPLAVPSTSLQMSSSPANQLGCQPPAMPAPSVRAHLPQSQTLTLLCHGESPKSPQAMPRWLGPSTDPQGPTEHPGSGLRAADAALLEPLLSGASERLGFSSDPEPVIFPTWGLQGVLTTAPTVWGDSRDVGQHIHVHSMPLRSVKVYYRDSFTFLIIAIQ